MIFRIHKVRKLSILGILSLITVGIILFINSVQEQSVANAPRLDTTRRTSNNKGSKDSDSSDKIQSHNSVPPEKIQNNHGDDGVIAEPVIPAPPQEQQQDQSQGQGQQDSSAPPPQQEQHEADHQAPNNDPIIRKQGEGVVIFEKSPFARQIESSKLPPANYIKEKATFFSLVRNSDLYGILQSIRQVEDRFNKNYHYDWVFVNDRPFNDNFKKLVHNLCSGNVILVELTPEFWSYPEWIDKTRAKEVRREMSKKRIKYGDSESYRHMCRFNSGLFYKLPALADYKYYWRVEPDIEYHCDIDYDPFRYMRENNKIYGFTLAPLEIHNTVTTLWSTVMNYTKEFPQNVAANNNMAFLTDDDGETFNMCHFWSNFEIGDLDFFRSEQYNHFFDYLDQSGGIYYERWGDAPIHTMAVSMLVPADQLFLVENTGYFHSPNGDCPRSLSTRLEKNCHCNPRYDFTWNMRSCIPKFFDVNNLERPLGAPKRKYKPIHNWDQVAKEDARMNRELKAKEELKEKAKEHAKEKARLEAGVDGNPPPETDSSESEQQQQQQVNNDDTSDQPVNNQPPGIVAIPVNGAGNGLIQDGSMHGSESEQEVEVPVNPQA